MEDRFRKGFITWESGKNMLKWSSEAAFLKKKIIHIPVNFPGR